MQYTASESPFLTDGKKQPYVPDENLVEAVNIAIALKRPLLLQGEPGSGKTQLARDIAFRLYYNQYKEQYASFYKEWFVKSTSKAMDGLYYFDNVARLRDAQLAAHHYLSAAEIEASKNPMTYVKYGPLGQSFLEKRERCVVLIDEIDKADLDFPNDLLLELDEKRFIIEEVRENNEVNAKKDPIIIITSNNEKSLPPAFLRRCVFYFISFPDKERLFEILSSHFPGSPQTLQDEVIDSFLAVREKLNATSKNVSTSELLNWFAYIQEKPNVFRAMKKNGDLAFKSILLKTMEALELFRNKTM